MLASFLKKFFNFSIGSYIFKKILVNSSISWKFGFTKKYFFFNSVLLFKMPNSLKLSSSLFTEFICSSMSLESHLIWKSFCLQEEFSKKNLSSILALHFDPKIFDISKSFIFLIFKFFLKFYVVLPLPFQLNLNIKFKANSDNVYVLYFSLSLFLL